MGKETISLDAMELMVSIDFKNRCSTDKMIAEMNLCDFAQRRLELKELQKAADLLGEYCKKQHTLGISPIWIEDAFDMLTVYIRTEEKRLDKGAEGAKFQLETIDKQLKEFEEKEKKKNGNNKQKSS